MVVRNSCDVEKSIDERVEEGFFRGYGHVVRMEEARIVKRVWQTELLGRPGCRLI